MCHRQLRFDNPSDCGHLTYTGQSNVDCHKPDCFLSSSHPKDCTEGGHPCKCRRYYTQPERIARDVAGKCQQCQT